MSKDPRHVADSHRLYVQPMEHRSPAAPQGTKRDQAPIPDAARRVIHEQNRQDRQERKRARREQPHPSPVAVGHAGPRTSLPSVPGHASAVSPQPRSPTRQEIYNTWRALGEQMNNIPRVPAFIKSDRMLCHRCRILKLPCNCYDYSELENAYQEEDHRLRQAALCQIPASDALLLPGASASPAVQYPTVSASYEYVDDSPIGDSEASGGPWQARQQQPSTLSPLPPTPLPPALATEPPRLLQYEIREEVLARERIGTHARLWCCQFSIRSPDGRVYSCSREDENLATIRRHYSREHGSLRCRKPPTLQTYCSDCGYEVPSDAPPPCQCPGCGAVDGRLWLRMQYAEVEVPIPSPLQLQFPESGSTDGLTRDMDGTNSADNIGGTVIAAPTEDLYAVSAPPEMAVPLQPPALVLPQQSQPQIATPISPDLYWMSTYPMAGGGNLTVDTNNYGGGSAMALQTPVSPGGFPPAPTAATTTATTPAPYAALAEATAIYPNAWGLPVQAEAQQPQHPQQQQQDRGVYYP